MASKLYGAVDSNKLPVNCHIVEVNREGFGYSVVHKHKGKLIYTAAFTDGHDAMRVASNIGNRQEMNGEQAFVLVNPHR